jgi:phage terminase large subunit GpA-like protein
MLQDVDSPILYDYEEAPYQKEILDIAFEEWVHEIVLVFGTQLGKTLIMMLLQAGLIKFSPNGMLFIQPSIDLASNYMRERFNPMVRDNNFLFDIIREKKEKESKSDSVFHKSFPHGYIAIGGANSPSRLASRPLPYLMLDEIDDYPLSAGKKGNPVKLAEKRTTNFEYKKIIKTSSPGLEGSSLIWPALELTDFRKYFVPCPACGHEQTLEWNQMRYPEKKAELSYYECANENCKEHLTNNVKRFMLRLGKWKPTQKGLYGKVGFHLNRLYSPWVSWEEMVDEKLSADKEAKRGSMEDAKVFINTGLALKYDPNYTITKKQTLLDRIGLYYHESPPMLPEGVVYITFGTDVQDNRIETIVVGWGIGEESWRLIKKTHAGNPALDYLWSEYFIWKQSLIFKHPYGVDLKISSGCIDTGGHHTDNAYDYIRDKQHLHYYAFKGSNTNKGPIAPREPSFNNKGKIPLYLINTVAAKDSIYARLQVEHPDPYKPTPGLMHFNQHCNDEYFDQLLSQKVILTNDGKAYRDIPNTRQEVIDCEVMAYAALKIDGRDLALVSEDLNQHKESKTKPVEKKELNRSSNWVTGWNK